jgi:hypothetical protein
MVGKGPEPWVIAKRVAFGDEQTNRELQRCIWVDKSLLISEWGSNEKERDSRIISLNIQWIELREITGYIGSSRIPDSLAD